jgi:hypothetical protein
LSNVQVRLTPGILQGSGTVALSARLPRYNLSIKLDGYPWSGGLLKADGTMQTSGLGFVALQNLQATGEFSGEGMLFNGAEAASDVNGEFSLAFNGSTPALKLTKVEAHQNGEDWLGEGVNNADGKLHVDLSNGDRQLHLVTEIIPPGRVP